MYIDLFLTFHCTLVLTAKNIKILILLTKQEHALWTYSRWTLLMKIATFINNLLMKHIDLKHNTLKYKHVY